MGLVATFRAEHGRLDGRLELLGIGVGLGVPLWPSVSALALLYVIGAYAISLGVIVIGSAFWLPFTGGDAVLLTLTGLLSIVFGVVMFANPGDGALVLLSLIAAFSLVFGLTELVVAMGGVGPAAWRRPRDDVPAREADRARLILAVLTVAGLRVWAQLTDVLVLVFVSVLFASAISRPATKLERRGVPRGVAVTVVQLVAMVVIVGLVWLVMPPWSPSSPSSQTTLPAT
jgi:hypothetical protein